MYRDNQAGNENSRKWENWARISSEYTVHAQYYSNMVIILRSEKMFEETFIIIKKKPNSLSSTN